MFKYLMQREIIMEKEKINKIEYKFHKFLILEFAETAKICTNIFNKKEIVVKSREHHVNNLYFSIKRGGVSFKIMVNEDIIKLTRKITHIAPTLKRDVIDKKIPNNKFITKAIGANIMLVNLIIFIEYSIVLFISHLFSKLILKGYHK